MADQQTPEHVVVIGAGMVGLATAWFLQEEGVRVTVVDREGVAAGSSWGNAGWLAPALTLPLPDPAILGTGVKAAISPSSPVYVPFTTNPQLLKFLAAFARHCTPGKWRAAMAVFTEANHRALDAFDALTAGGVAEPTRVADPFVAAFLSEQDRDGLVHEFEHVAEVGGRTEYELVDGDALRSIEPALSEAVTHGVLLRDQRYINPGRFVHALADAVQAKGGDVLSGVEVKSVDRAGRRVEVRPVKGDVIDANAVVIASGTWLGRLAKPHGVETIVQAGRGYSFTVQPEVKPANPVYFPAQRVACTPLIDPGRAGRVPGRRDDGVPPAEGPTGPATHPRDRRRGQSAAARRRLGRPQRRVGRLPTVHRGRVAARRTDSDAGRARRRRSRHVGHRARSAHRAAARCTHRAWRDEQSAPEPRPAAMTRG